MSNGYFCSDVVSSVVCSVVSSKEVSVVSAIDLDVAFSVSVSEEFLLHPAVGSSKEAANTNPAYLVRDVS